MEKIALFYSFNSKKTAKIAGIVHNALSGEDVQRINIDEVKIEDFLAFDNLIVGVPTWFDGELPNYWDEILPALDDLELNGKKVALFGLGDQKNYPENFCDAVGILGEFFEGKGAKIIGHTSPEGYSFESSKALKENILTGLLLDQENQSKLSDERILKWTKQLEHEFS